MDRQQGRKANHRLRNERLERQWSQQNLANRLGTTKLSVGRWERGITSPTPYFRLKLVQLFDKSESELGLSEEISQTLAQDDRENAESSQQETENVFVSEKPEVEQASEKHSISPNQERSRKYMLEQIHTIWISGMLKNSLHGMVPLVLGLREEPSIVDDPWRLLLQEIERPASNLPLNTPIEDIYDTVNGQLLILGEPGSGKTTLLLELTKKLLERARKDSQHLIPVVFNLSSWAIKRLSLTQWLIEELHEKYQVPHVLAQEWVQENMILPLLDGLDEVVAPQRTACVKALNIYRKDHGLQPLVICCRQAEYLEQTQKIHLHSAVIIQTLTRSQIEDYLGRWGNAVAGLQSAIQKDTELQELATTPLMLSILALTYHSQPIDEILSQKPEHSRQHQIFENYTSRMLGRRTTRKRYTPTQTIYWLTHLAKQLHNQKHTTFYLEQMQFSWLENPRMTALLPGIVMGLVFGFSIGLIIGLMNGLFTSPWLGLEMGTMLGIFNTGLYIFCNSAILGWGSYLLTIEEKPASLPEQVILFVLPWLRKQITYGLVFAVYNGFFYGLCLTIFNGPYDIHTRMIYGLIYGTLIGFGAAGLGPLIPVIEPAEMLSWSWHSVRKKVLRFIPIGIMIGLVYGFIYPLPVKGGLLLVGICGAIFIAGWSHGAIEKQHKQRPNQGIWRSARNSITCMLIAGSMTWLFLGSTFAFVYGPQAGVLYGCVPGIVVGLSLGLLQGGIPCLLHGTLRLLLWSTGVAPWRYTDFLDEAASSILVRKIGGGYIFVHRLLLDYFVSLGNEHEKAVQIRTDHIKTARRTLLAGSAALVVGSSLILTRLTSLISRPAGLTLNVYVHHSRKVFCVDIAPDSTLVASGSEDGTVRVWSAMTGDDLLVLTGYGQSPNSIAWSPNGKSIAFVCEDGAVQVWNVYPKRCLLNVAGTVHNQGSQKIAWSPDGQFLVATGAINVLRIWDMHHSQPPLTIGATQKALRAVTWSAPVATRLAYSGDDRIIHFWDNIQQQRTEIMLNELTNLTKDTTTIMSLAWSPDGRFLAAGTYDAQIVIWNMQTGTFFSINYGFPTYVLYTVAWSPNSKYLVVSGSHGAKIFDINTNTIITSYENHKGRSFAAVWSTNGQFIASASSDGTVHIWQAPTP